MFLWALQLPHVFFFQLNHFYLVFHLISLNFTCLICSVSFKKYKYNHLMRSSPAMIASSLIKFTIVYTHRHRFLLTNMRVRFYYYSVSSTTTHLFRNLTLLLLLLLRAHINKCCLFLNLSVSELTFSKASSLSFLLF